ncbi:hypothetical protein HZC32_00055 [Candidatus Woesearchaeota archaeon]|nr:hypothetical protein [Candidatus Woesearchaeota archaeon]
MLRKSIGNPYLLLKKILPRPKSREQLQAEEQAQKEVVKICKKIEREPPFPNNELYLIEQEITTLNKELKS